MGNSQSDGTDRDANGNGKGLHVLKVAANSPALHAGIEPYFDYITRVNNERVGSLDDWKQAVGSESKAEEQKPLLISLYSSKTNSHRTAIVTPATENGHVGVSVRPCSGGDGLVWRVLDVLPNSPAELAGLTSLDYILACPSHPLKSPADLSAILLLNEGRSIDILVYNIELDVVRNVCIVPGWDGEGVLGCDLGVGRGNSIWMGIQERAEKSKTTNVVVEGSGGVRFEKHDSLARVKNESATNNHSHANGNESHQDHGQSHDSHGQSYDSHGQSHDSHGQSDHTHGQSYDSHSKSHDSHGQSDHSQGQSHDSHGQSDHSNSKEPLISSENEKIQDDHSNCHHSSEHGHRHHDENFVKINEKPTTRLDNAHHNITTKEAVKRNDSASTLLSNKK